jgi:hypothetical protein
MKKYIIKISFWLLLITTIQPLSAQFIVPPVSPEASDLARIKAAYSQAGTVSCKMTYLLFAPSATQATDSMVGLMTLFGSDYHFKIAHFEYIQQGDRLLYLDHEAHEMILFKANRATNDPKNAGQITSTLEQEGVAKDLKNLGGNKRKLTLDPLMADANNIEIWYNTNTYFIERLRTVLPQNKAVLDIKYGQINHEKGGLKTAIATYAVFKNKKYTPTEKFKNYKFRVNN